MRTEPECLVCFMRQALSTARLSSEDSEMHSQVVTETGSLLARLDLSLSPPENAVAVYKQIAELTGVEDPYAQLKLTSNAFAQELRHQVRELIDRAEDPLLAAVRYAIAGNIIDYGAQHAFDAMHVIEQCMEEHLAVNDFELLRSEVNRTGGMNILYLADNCGELVFDALLVEQLLRHGHNVTLVVRGDEILNDATLRDARDVGLDKLCTVISNGNSCPGTSLESCSDVLRQTFMQADIVVSKGQGNFETLSEVSRPVYFLLTVKCAVVARHIEAMTGSPAGRLQGNGEMVLMKMEGQNAYATD